MSIGAWIAIISFGSTAPIRDHRCATARLHQADLLDADRFFSDVHSTRRPRTVVRYNSAFAVSHETSGGRPGRRRLHPRGIASRQTSKQLGFGAALPSPENDAQPMGRAVVRQGHSNRPLRQDHAVDLGPCDASADPAEVLDVNLIAR
jgi:hypothetical protein